MKKKPAPKPRPKAAWGIMHERTRTIISVYVGGYSKDYVTGDCAAGQIPVRVRVIPA